MAAAAAAERASGYLIEESVFQRLPGARVAVAMVTIFVENVPKNKQQQNFLSERKQQTVREFVARYPQPSDFEQSKAIVAWRNVFKTFHTDAQKRCTLEPLFSRISREGAKVVADPSGKTKANLGKISNIVDLANCISADFEVPIGVMDFNLLKGRLTLRDGKAGEVFTPLGEDETYEVNSQHLVLADSARVLSWLWTCKVGKDVCVQPTEKGQDASTVLICVDQPEEEAGDAEKALDKLLEELPKIGGIGRKIGLLSKENPEIFFT